MLWRNRTTVYCNNEAWDETKTERLLHHTVRILWPGNTSLSSAWNLGVDMNAWLDDSWIPLCLAASESDSTWVLSTALMSMLGAMMMNSTCVRQYVIVTTIIILIRMQIILKHGASASASKAMQRWRITILDWSSTITNTHVSQIPTCPNSHTSPTGMLSFHKQSI